MRPMRIVFTVDRPERADLLLWLRAEWEYADQKFDDQRPLHDRHMADTGLDDDGWWLNQFLQYVARARTLGLNRFAGRQAVAKCLAAYTGAVESVIRVYGFLPDAGYPSGTVLHAGQPPEEGEAP